jgi:kynurenine--oxoglutarate transaminase/cysteine-S-conjugate beta-lyase/glutamine--phenylpyruvate transaminase
MCQTPEQEAVAVALEKELTNLGTPDSYFHKLCADLREKRDYLVEAVRDAGMNPVIPQGGYFLVTNWTPLGTTLQQGCIVISLYKIYIQKFKA